MADALLSRVRSEDATLILEGVARLSAAADLDALSRELPRICADLIPAEHASYAELDPFFGRTVDRSTEPDFTAALLPLWDAWQAVMHTQPIIRHYQANPGDAPRRMSDVVDDAGLRQTPSWTEVMHPLRCDRQLVLYLGQDPAAGPVAAPLMLGVNINRVRQDFADHEVAALTLLQRLVRPLFRIRRAERHCRRLFDEPYGPEAQRLLMGLGLSPRQAEVAYWILRDRTNPEIGDILRVGSQTVRQHSMTIYDKVGVAGRLDLQRAVLAAVWGLGGRRDA